MKPETGSTVLVNGVTPAGPAQATVSRVWGDVDTAQMPACIDVTTTVDGHAQEIKSIMLYDSLQDALSNRHGPPGATFAFWPTVDRRPAIA